MRRRRKETRRTSRFFGGGFLLFLLLSRFRFCFRFFPLDRFSWACVSRVLVLRVSSRLSASFFRVVADLLATRLFFRGDKQKRRGAHIDRALRDEEDGDCY